MSGRSLKNNRWPRRLTPPSLALLRVHALLALRGFRLRIARGESRASWLLGGLVLLAFLPLVQMFFGISVGFYEAGAMVGQPHAVLVMAFSIGQLAALSFGVLYVLSSFYFAKDLSLLVPLPLRARDIVLAKFLTILMGELATLAPLVLPAVAVYGLRAGVSLLYWPVALLVYVLLPVPALAVAALFSLGLMRLTRGRANRDALRVAGGLFAMTLAVGIQFLNRYNAYGQSGRRPGAFELGTAVAQGLPGVQGSLADALARWTPTSLWAADVLRVGPLGSRLPGQVLFVAVTALAFWLLLTVAERAFFGGLVGGGEVRAARRRVTGEELVRETERLRTPLAALIRREIWLVNRNPSFLMAAAVPPIILPLLLLVPFLTDPEARALLALAPRVAHSPLVPLVAIAAVVFTASSSNLAASAISREGRHFWVSRVIPVAPRLQVMAKLLHGMLFMGLDLAVALFVLGFLGFLTAATVTSTLVGALVGGMAMGAGGVLIDLWHPNLTWTDPQQAMKGNINVLLALVLMMLVLGLGALAAVAGWFLIGPQAAVPATILLLAAVAAVLTTLAGSVAERRYASIED